MSSTPAQRLAILRAFYGPSNRSTLFRAQGKYYGPFGHHGLDLGASRRQSIPALRSGRVADVWKSSVIGYCMSVDVDGSNEFDGYAHIWGGAIPRVGTQLWQAQQAAIAASAGDFTGSAWSGEHLHLTRSRYVDGVLGADSKVLDPLGAVDPVLRALQVAASPTSTPVPSTLDPKGLTLMAFPDCYLRNKGNQGQPEAHIYIDADQTSVVGETEAQWLRATLNVPFRRVDYDPSRALEKRVEASRLRRAELIRANAAGGTVDIAAIAEAVEAQLADEFADVDVALAAEAEREYVLSPRPTEPTA